MINMPEASGSRIHPFSRDAANEPVGSSETATFTPFPIDDVESSIPARFEKIVAWHGHRLAIDGQRPLTYDELNLAANRIASAIVKARDTAAEPVALLFEQGTDVIAAILGVLKAGKFFVSLDPAYHLEWNRRICDDAGTRTILANR